MKRPEAECSKLTKETEAVFEFLVAQGNKNGFNVDLILEIPDLSGGACFAKALRCSEKIRCGLFYVFKIDLLPDGWT